MSFITATKSIESLTKEQSTESTIQGSTVLETESSSSISGIHSASMTTDQASTTAPMTDTKIGLTSIYNSWRIFFINSFKF